MTKLYHGNGAWQVPGQQEKGAERVDVPSSPAELAAWLNDRGVNPNMRRMPLAMPPAIDLREDAPPEAPAPIAGNGLAPGKCPNCHRTQDEAKRLAAEADASAVQIVLEERILEETNPARLAALAGAVIQRIQELRKGLK